MEASWHVDEARPFVELARARGSWVTQPVPPRSPNPVVPRRVVLDRPDPWSVLEGLPDGVRVRNLSRASWDAWIVEGGAPDLDVGTTLTAPLPGLWVTDMDSTLIEQEVIDELAREGGRYEEVARITERAMRGELDFASSLRERVRALQGLQVQVIDEVRARITPTAGAARTVKALRSLGCTTAVVSGGFMEVVEPFARQIGLDHAHANRLEVQDGLLTGRLAAEVFDAQAKVRVLEALQAELGLNRARVAAVGDGANDLPMLEAAGVGIAFCAKPKVRERAEHRIDRRRLDEVLYLWGLSDQDVDRLENSARS